MAVAELPTVDTHGVTIAASADDVWSALVETLDRSFGHGRAAAYARLVGCTPAAASGPRPLQAGATITGFEVMTATQPALLELAGRHRFAEYSLTFRIEGTAGPSSRLTAESRARFPGVSGGVYRALVIGTRLHVLAVRRLLARVDRAAVRS